MTTVMLIIGMKLGIGVICTKHQTSNYQVRYSNKTDVQHIFSYSLGLNQMSSDRGCVAKLRQTILLRPVVQETPKANLSKHPLGIKIWDGPVPLDVLEKIAPLC